MSTVIEWHVTLCSGTVSIVVGWHVTPCSVTVKTVIWFSVTVCTVTVWVVVWWHITQQWDCEDCGLVIHLNVLVKYQSDKNLKVFGSSTNNTEA